MSTASHSEPAPHGSQPSDELPLTAAVRKRMPLACGLCLKTMAAEGRYRWRLGSVCRKCDAFVDSMVDMAPPGPKPAAPQPKFTPCPAKGIAAGYDPRVQLPPDAVVVGDFMSDWLAKRATAAAA